MSVCYALRFAVFGEGPCDRMVWASVAPYVPAVRAPYLCHEIATVFGLLHLIRVTVARPSMRQKAAQTGPRCRRSRSIRSGVDRASDRDSSRLPCRT